MADYGKQVILYCVCFVETRPAATATPITVRAERPLLEAHPLPLEHALLQVLKIKTSAEE